MCDEMNSDDKYNVCDNCRLKDYGCPAIYESENASTDWGHIEKVVTAWAAEHPEPVYPSWGEWFVEHGDLVDGWQNATNAAWMANTALSIFMKPIPADIAQKLGLQPKEG